MRNYSKPKTYKELAAKCYDVCSKIYIARNITLSEEAIKEQLKEIDLLLREENVN